MTTAVHTMQDDQTTAEAARPPIRPEGEAVFAPDATATATVMNAPMMAASPVRAPAPPAISHMPIDRSGFVGRVSHWIDTHRDAPKHGAGHVVYQFLRSCFACIPYALSMAGVLAGFTAMETKGGKLAADATASAFTRGFGARLKQFASTPAAKMSALIGASFTFYRGSSKLAKWMTEYLFNPKDNEQRTQEKVRDLPQEAWRKIKEIAPAEVSSTPIAAIVLGFIVSYFQKPSAAALKTVINGAEHSFDWTRASFKALPNLRTKLGAMWHAIFNPKAKFWEQALINTFGYALFFELGDRLYKDTQIRRGVWSGEANSIKSLKAAPDEYEQGIQKKTQSGEARKYEESALEGKPEKDHFASFTAEPSLGRFAFRRVLPTAVSIGLYTAFKMRHGAMLGNNFAYDKGISTGQFFKKAWGEGAATSLFFMIPLVSEFWEKAYDNFFKKLEDRFKQPAPGAPTNDNFNSVNDNVVAKVLTPHQQQKYDELLAKVCQKEAATGRVA